MGPPRPPLVAKARPLPRTRIGGSLSVIAELSGEVCVVFVLEWSVCGAVISACVNEQKRTRNTKEKSEFFFVIAKKYVIYMPMAG